MPLSLPLSSSDESRRFPCAMLWVAGLLTLALIGSQFGHLFRSFRTLALFEKRDLAIENLCGKITHLDEVLTMSARMGAATGDPTWEERYIDHVGPLDEAIAGAQELAPEDSAAQGNSQTDQANQALIAMEAEAFDLVRDGESTTALELLMSQEYRQQKAIYAAGVATYLASMRSNVVDSLRSERGFLWRALIGNLLVIVALVLIWGSVTRAASRHLRMREKAEQDARDARAAAEQANQAKSTYLAGMSHEIRTPLGAISGYAELLVGEDFENQQAREYVDGIHSGADHLLQLVNNILDISKIEAGKMALEQRALDPVELLRGVSDMTRHSVDRKGLELDLTVREPVPRHVVSDPTRLRQILINLVGNAVKFTDTGAITLELSSRDGELMFAVVDSGAGIAPDRLERIFDLYEQEDATIARRFGGTGMGLNLSRQLAELLGGTLRARSQPGVGSRFELTLPVLEGEQPASIAAQPRGTESTLRAPLEGRILVVDDTPINRIVVVRMLDQAGFETAEVEGGPQALEAIRSAEEARSPFDIVLMDLQMPDMDGFEAAARLRKTGFEGLLLAFTADVFVRETGEEDLADFDGLVTKPVQREELLERLGSLLAERAARSSKSHITSS